MIGRPNVGKSTLINLFVGEKIAIVSKKPQTTRKKSLGILSASDSQIIFIDTPGIHRPKSKLGDYMVSAAESVIEDSDVILFITEPLKLTPHGDKAILKRLARVKGQGKKNPPVFLLINKVDTIRKPELLTIIDQYAQLYDFDEIFPISALKADNTEPLLDAIKCLMPEGPVFYPTDEPTDMPMRQIAAEIIREKALYYLHEEIPHGIAVETLSMKKDEETGKLRLEANIYCEKEQHKKIIIGKDGTLLKKIGTTSRIDIEEMTGEKIFLDLWVKTKKDWRDNLFLLKSFGYDIKKIK